jgi:hypothetical protein
MRRLAITLVGLAVAAVGAGFASADTLNDYSVLRQHLYDCNLNTDWGQMGESGSAECDDLFRDYVLWADSAPTETLYIHCRSASKCIATPDGMPSASGPIPNGAFVYDTKPRATSAAKAKAASHKRRHHRHHT